jgi:hypothetical protein
VHARDLVLAKVVELAGGKRAERVHLADLRDALPELERATVDRELLALQTDGTLVLYRNDNTASLKPRDRAAELLIAGHPRHLVLLDKIPTPASTGSTEERVLAAFDELERTDRLGLYSLADVRRLSGVAKAEFDRTVLDLARRRVLTLHHHDYPASLSPAARAELVVAGGAHYHAGARSRTGPRS